MLGKTDFGIPRVMGFPAYSMGAFTCKESCLYVVCVVLWETVVDCMMNVRSVIGSARYTQKCKNDLIKHESGGRIQ